MNERRLAELMKGAATEKRSVCVALSTNWEIFTKEIDYWQGVMDAYDIQSKAEA